MLHCTVAAIHVGKWHTVRRENSLLESMMGQRKMCTTHTSGRYQLIRCSGRDQIESTRVSYSTKLLHKDCTSSVAESNIFLVVSV